MQIENQLEKQSCFVIMPISDVENYDVGHFGRVYEHIIKPACRAAELQPIRADEVQITNYIVIDILRKIIEADMVICDLSSRNPNVLYELGIRQAFNLPVTLIRDSRTPRIFDIQGLRDIEYDESLRIDKINSAVESLANTLRNTSRLDHDEVNSIIQLLGVTPANLPSVEVSKDTSLLLDAIGDIGKRLSRLEDINSGTPKSVKTVKPEIPRVLDSKAKPIFKGARVWIPNLGEGEVVFISEGYIGIDLGDGAKLFRISDKELTGTEVITESKQE